MSKEDPWTKYNLGSNPGIREIINDIFRIVSKNHQTESDATTAQPDDLEAWYVRHHGDE